MGYHCQWRNLPLVRETLYLVSFRARRDVATDGACACSFNHSMHNERRGNRRNGVDLGIGRKSVPASTLSLSSTNGSSSSWGEKTLGVQERTTSTKMIVAVDVDEVLGSFLAALNRFVADRYSWNHSVSDYHVYEFCKGNSVQIWNCSPEKASSLVHEFFGSQYFQNGIHPIPGALDALQNLSSFCTLSVVTSRQNAIKDQTLEWIEKYYPAIFEQIHFGNHFALQGPSKPKSEICRSFGAQVLIDDNPRYALECAEAGMKVLLFDFHNSYPWCKTGADQSHPLVTKVHSRQEVEQKLRSWI